MNGYLLTLDQTEEFFKRCIEQNAHTFQERLAIMKEMAKERRAFFQTAEQLTKRMKGKRVLKITNGPNS